VNVKKIVAIGAGVLAAVMLLVLIAVATQSSDPRLAARDAAIKMMQNGERPPVPSAADFQRQLQAAMPPIPPNLQAPAAPVSAPVMPAPAPAPNVTQAAPAPVPDVAQQAPTRRASAKPRHRSSSADLL
jgi:hypothetical protein